MSPAAALQIVPKTPSAQKRRPIRFRGRSFMALVLAPEAPADDWLLELDQLTARSPGFFGGRPVVLDVSGLKPSARAMGLLLTELEARGVRTIGVEGCDPKTLEGPYARLAMPIGGRAAGELSAPEAPAPQATSLVIDQPVRSGQTITFPHGDVTICGSVASGAEIVAAGSIHVYGALRGRAIAGSAGNAKARIFCRKLDAELLAIDGVYMTTDDLDKGLRGKPARAWLNGEILSVAALD
ncbi:septum site-determining protein MinC [Hansschlegelia plantiphila]|uniref:Probable septum site-determining protein MinC n=1 Tax=Hansschlegelia plantiphila TaxID=374655 RepID=A0A9W6MVE6_9HYPH|nr:septum site-determining protein MinC [Hansschlegelia plantiphila]GLK67888.1 putative septum site-determining protein MinC [Hansschlegelia plantiphila]